MNEQQNTALIQNVYRAFANGDIQTIMNSLTGDVDWALEGPAIVPFSGRRKGGAEVLRFFQALAETQQDMKLTTETFVAQGDVVATLGRYSATVKATGKKFDVPIGHFFTIRDGKIARFVDLSDTAAMADAYVATSARAAR
ncbi:MAG TPA: nuclear transport factor 2 family protein [Candidatus Acidoferrales bacterium]|jgi:ketosteroid isomerase-like protein|nr:nuclear transport factor 2 family protein [Candidatus Acidoferrales bacterium]